MCRPYEQRDPGNDPQCENRNEIPPRALAAVLRRQEAREVLVDEEEIEEFRIAQRDGDEPWCRDDEEDRHACGEMQAPPDLPVASQHRIDQQGAAGQHDADQPLGKGSKRERGPCRPHPFPGAGWGGFVTLREKETPEADAHPQGEAGVERENVRLEREPETPGKYNGGCKSERRVCHSSGHVTDKHYGKKSCHGWPQPSDPLAHSERLVSGGGDPVLKGRLLEILDAIQPRCHPITARDHLARDLGVTALIGMYETAEVEIGEPEQCEDDQQRDRAASR